MFSISLGMEALQLLSKNFSFSLQKLFSASALKLCPLFFPFPPKVCLVMEYAEGGSLYNGEYHFNFLELKCKYWGKHHLNYKLFHKCVSILVAIQKPPEYSPGQLAQGGLHDLLC